MSDDFGPELVNVISDLQRLVISEAGYNDRFGPGVDLVEYFSRLFDPRLPLAGDVQSGVILYFPPGRYRVSFQSDGLNSFVIPRNVQLYFASGALLRPERGVTLIIDGSIRAGLQQIFGYERAVRLPTGIIGTNTAPLGRIILTSELIPEVYPEWWGAEYRPDAADANVFERGYDNSDALQAAINAACIQRDHPAGEVRRPSIPVVLSGRYQTNHTLTVDCPPGTPDLHLILRGSTGLSPNFGRAQSIVRVLRTGDPTDNQCALRIGPRVDFDIQDLAFDMPAEAAVEGCVDVVSEYDGGTPEIRPRRGLFRRCAFTSGRLYGLRVTSGSNATLRHVVVDSCEIVPQNVSYLTERAVDVSGNPSLMLHLDGALMGTGQLELRYPLPPTNATIHLRGASVLVRATQFHNGTGPRPSPAPGTPEADGALPIDLTKPDGQEVFLERLEDSSLASASQFTAMQCECQGWWFFSRPRAGDEQVVLLNVTQENVNWSDQNILRLEERGGQPTAGTVFGHPPSVVWLGSGGQCAFVACRFDQSVLLDADSWQAIVNAATFFKDAFVRPLSRNDPHYVEESRDGRTPQSLGVGYAENFRRYPADYSILRPPSYASKHLLAPDMDAYDNRIPHVVPIRRVPE